MAIGHRSKGANDQAGEDLRFFGFGLGSGFLVLVIVTVVVVFGSLFRLGLGQSLGELALSTLHVNRDAVIFRSARGDTVHAMRTTGLVDRNRRLS